MTYLEGDKDGEDVGDRKEGLSEDQKTHHPGQPHHHHQRHRGLHPVPGEQRVGGEIREGE